jgi:hypothetical protein
MISNVISHEIPVSAIYDTRDYVFLSLSFFCMEKNSVMAFGRKRVPDFMCMCFAVLYFSLLPFIYSGFCIYSTPSNLSISTRHTLSRAKYP